MNDMLGVSLWEYKPMRCLDEVLGGKQGVL